METCPICFASVATDSVVFHMRFHKQHNHHGPMCALHIPRHGLVLDTDPLPPCTCLMQFVSLY